MKNGTCIKCGSKEVYTTKDGAQYSMGISRRWRSLMEFENYLCIDCGYLETYYVFDPPEVKKEKHREMYKKTFEKRLQGIKDNWEKVTGY